MKSRILLALIIGLGLLGVSSLRAANLFPDPSFEEPQEPDQYGHVFKQWGGWIWDGPARWEASTVAHSGKYSAEIIGDHRTTIRLESKEIPEAKEIPIEPGRYRVTLFIRGIDIAQGPGMGNVNFSIFDGKFMAIKVGSNFGWTPLTYVFEVTPDAKSKKIRLFIGFYQSTGRLWVDDADLEKVDDTVALTPAPVLGKEEAPIASPGPLGDHPVHCPGCGYLNPSDVRQCYACGHALAAPAAADVPPVKVLWDFEDGKPAPFSGGKIVTENVPQGKYALKIVGNSATATFEQDWSQYDYLRFDAFNPTDVPISGEVQLRDKQARGYWTWVNLGVMYPPGKSTISIRTDMYVGEKSRPGRPLNSSAVTFLAVMRAQGLIVDNFRLEKLDTSAANVPGLLACHFAPINAPPMEGFQAVAAMQQYSPARGYGWQNGKFWRGFNVLQPDALTQSFICPTGGAFRADVPNGKYHVVLNLDSPGGFWGEVQIYDTRRVTANGKVVVDEKMTYESFLKNYFRNARHEDLPGLSAFDEYVQKMFHPKSFDVDVTDGKIEIGFAGETWANCLSYLVIYPDSQAAAGQKFMDWVTDRRRIQFNDYFKQIEPKQAAPPATPCVLFTRDPGTPVNAYDGPAAGETIGPDGLSLSVAGGEISALNFAVQPGNDLGTLDLSISDLKNEKGDVFDKAALVPGWLDYRIGRIAGDGSTWRVELRYWYPTPAPEAAKVTRRFWIQVKTPAAAAPGTYTGQITFKPQNGQPQTIPLSLRVLPFALDPITDVAVGPWGCNIPLPDVAHFPPATPWRWAMFDKSLDVIKAAGCTSFSGVPSLRAKGVNGKIELDTSGADREMEIIRAKGFTQMVSSYGANIHLGYDMYGTKGPDEAAAKAAGFPDLEAYLKALYTAIDAHAVEKNWVPVAYNLCDEPLGAEIGLAAENVKIHARIAAGLQRTTFMGATSMALEKPGDDITKSSHYELVKAFPMPSLNLHDEAALKVIHDAGHVFSFYNGGNRWTYGRYMKFLVSKYNMAMRLNWHFNLAAGDPYYALDCREDDYCWYNTDADQTMVPNIGFLARIIPGLNDYRYLSTLQRLLKEKPNHPAAAAGQALFDKMMDLRAGADRGISEDPGDRGRNPDFAADRAAVTAAIEALLK